MSESLKELSDRATPGEAYADMGDYRLIAHPPGSTYIPDRTLVALCACGDKAGANVHFLAALWTTYRRGELHDDTALATDVARARREALEEAAKVARARAATCKAAAGEWLSPEDASHVDMQIAAGMSTAMDQCEQVADEILALRAATPPEARQTETGWKPPAGWKLVPEKPTEEMVSAAWMKTGDRARYSAMLAAAPPPPAIGNLEGEPRS